MARLRSNSGSNQTDSQIVQKKRKLSLELKKVKLPEHKESRKLTSSSKISENQEVKSSKLSKKVRIEIVGDEPLLTPRRASRTSKIELPSTSIQIEEEDDGVKTRRVQKSKSGTGPRCALCRSGDCENDEQLFSCKSCTSSYHVMKCLKYNKDFANEIYKSKNWVCARCVRCASCDQFIGDPSNVECSMCCRAWHGDCAPNGKKKNDFFDSAWVCASCCKKNSIHNGTPSKKSPVKKEKKNDSEGFSDDIKLVLKNSEIDQLIKERRVKWDRLIEEAGYSSPAKSVPPSLTKRNLKEMKTSTKVEARGRRSLFTKPSTSASRLPDPSDDEDEDQLQNDLVTEFDSDLYKLASRAHPEENENNISSIEQWVYLGGKYASKALHKSAYEEEVRDSPVVHICKFCFYATHIPTDYRIHCENCVMHFPPGNEIYRDGNLSFFEVDGAKQTLYCRDLCMLAKLFISSKTLYHEVETFLFYILCEITNDGFVMVGYFSKEKNPSKNNNLSCLLTLPTSQKMGYGRFLIDMSYALSRLELKVGSPEHPISDLGVLAYRGYWRSSLLCYLRSQRNHHHITIKDISMHTRLTPVDVVNQLLFDNLLSFKGDTYYIKTGKRAFKFSLSRLRRRYVDMTKLKWTPNKAQLKTLDPHRLNFYVIMPCRLRRITVYETTGRFYIVGCDSTGSKYNVLKIDRIDPKVLLTGEPETDYTREEILELLATISEGSSVVYRSSSKKGTKSGLVERVSNAFGILGVVRFLEGYYLIIITKAHAIATLGYHPIYKVAEVAMINIAMDGVSSSSEEQKYVKLFQSVDLSTDFYFSYTYDLSRSFQDNALRIDWKNNGARKLEADNRFVWNNYLLEPLRKNLISERWFVEIVHGYVRQEYIFLPICRLSFTLIGRRSTQYAGTRFLKRGANPHGQVANFVETEQIVWDMTSSPNVPVGRFSSFVQIRGSVPMRWSQDPSTRGVVGKPLILIDNHEPHAQTAASHFRDLRNKYGSPIVIMNLIKRNEKRSHEGVLHTQFLKNIEYLNQFLSDDEKLCYLSFDVARCNKAANSMPSINVLNVMEDLSMKSILKSGWFQSFQVPEAIRIRHRDSFATLKVSSKKEINEKFLLQRGVCRTNCVDCLDRTNVAQFVIAKAALGCQLCAMGILDEPNLNLQSEVCRLLEDMFDEHGDTMALQYAGSQLVHSIKTYKKTAAFQERRRDVFQTLSRYYSNTFGDYDKQAAINLFLGMFKPKVSSQKHLWEMTTDYFLHFPYSLKIRTDYCAWTLSEKELKELVFVGYEDCDDDEEDFVEVRINKGEIEETNCRRQSDSSGYASLKFSSTEDFRDYYRTYEFTSLDDRVGRLFSIENRAIHIDGINQEPTSSAQFLKLWKTNESKEKEPPKRAAKKEDKESDDEDDDEEAMSTQWSDVVEAQKEWYDMVNTPGNVTHSQKTTSKKEANQWVSTMPLTPMSTPRHRSRATRSLLSTGLSFAKDIYHLEHLKTLPEERSYYEKYSRTSFKCDKKDWEKLKPTLLSEFKINSEVEPRRPTFFTADDCFRTEPPEVSKSTQQFYEHSAFPDAHHVTCSKKDYSHFSKYLSVA